MLEDGTISLNEGPRNVPIIVKSNTVGVLQVIKDTIAQFDHKDLDLSVVSAKTGHINGGDVDFAETVKAPIFGFSVDIPQAVAKYAIERNVKIYKQRIIYMMIDDIRDHMSSCLDPVETEVLLGKADILQTFELNNNRRGVPNPVVAGCKVTSGEMDRKHKFRVVRGDNEDSVVILDNVTASSLRHFKKTVESVTKGNECGVIFDDKVYEFETGDKIVCYKTKMVKQKVKSVY